MNWNTQQLVSELTELLSDVKIKMHNPGGDYDTKEITIRAENTSIICITGFNPEKRMESLANSENPEHDIPFVEIRTNDSDSEGGIPYNANDATRNLYHKVIDFFNTKKVEIIKHYDEIF